MVSSVQISNEEITVTNWSGRQTLRWDEITSASFHFSELRLYDSTRNRMLVVDLHVFGYETILETIMRRRYDLFKYDADFTISSKVFVPPYWSVVVTLIFILVSIYRGTNSWIGILIIYAVFQVFIFLGIISEIRTTGETISIKRSLRNLSSYTANEIASISLGKRTTFHLGTRYSVLQLHLKNGKTIDIEAGRMGEYVYKQLANWHTAHGV